MSFADGDHVLIDGAQIATLTRYDESANIFTAEVKLAGGSVNRVTGHISNTRIEALPALPFVTEDDAVVTDDATPVEPTEKAK